LRLILLATVLAIVATSFMTRSTPRGKNRTKLFYGTHASSSAEGVKGSHESGNDPRSGNDPVSGGSAKFEGVLTYHNDLARTGQNLSETTLTPANVNAGSFGKLFSIPLDGALYAQPLYMPNVNVPGRGIHNVVFAATENNTVFAFDADDPKGIALWISHIGTPVKTDVQTLGACFTITPIVGITGTPVIDPRTHTLYVVALDSQDSGRFYRLHALDIATGKERDGSPITITATLPGTGSGQQSGNVTFNPSLQLQRPGLALVGGNILIEFGSSCDLGEFHGWIYAYNAETLARQAAFLTTPNGDHGGIWQAGAAPVVDSQGNLFVITGDGTFDVTSGGSDYGDAFLKLKLDPNRGFVPLDYFAPFDQSRLEELNEDLGSSGAVLLPSTSSGDAPLLVGGAKNGTIYVLNPGNLGHFNPKDNSQIVQSLTAAEPKIDSAPAYWANSSSQYLYINGVGGPLQAYTVANGMLSPHPTSHSDELYGYPGSTPSISSNGNSDGIVWMLGTVEPGTGAVTGAYLNRIWTTITNVFREPGRYFHKVMHSIKAFVHSPSLLWQFIEKWLPSRAPEVVDSTVILRAYDATDVGVLLYDSRSAPEHRDQTGRPVKFAVPTIANGKVYFATQDHLLVFGLLNK
jgi:hypothetical protein